MLAKQAKLRPNWLCLLRDSSGLVSILINFNKTEYEVIELKAI
jgi:hypothetical protein